MRQRFSKELPKSVKYEFWKINEISQEEIDVLKHFKDIINYLVKFGFLEEKLSKASKVVELRKLLRVSNLTNILNISYFLIHTQSCL